MKLLIGILSFYTGSYYKSLNEEMVGGLFNLIGLISILWFLADLINIYEKWSKKRLEKWKAEQQMARAKKFIEEEEKKREFDIKRKEFIEKHGWDPWGKKTSNKHLPLENDDGKRK